MEIREGAKKEEKLIIKLKINCGSKTLAMKLLCRGVQMVHKLDQDYAFLVNKRGGASLIKGLKKHTFSTTGFGIWILEGERKKML